MTTHQTVIIKRGASKRARSARTGAGRIKIFGRFSGNATENTTIGQMVSFGAHPVRPYRPVDHPSLSAGRTSASLAS